MPDISNGSFTTRVIQASNIAPQATKDQMQTLFSAVGKVEDIRLYPMIRDVAVPVQVRICFVKFADPTSVGIAQHLANTVFIDRAIMVIPYDAGDIPDEAKAMEILSTGTTIPSVAEPKLPPHLICTVEGIPPNQTIATADSRLAIEGLPSYPPIPASLDSRKIEEIRRTVVAVNIESELSADQVIDFFSAAGEVKYFRFCSREGDGTKYALVEFTDQSSIYPALKLNNTTLGENVVRIQHATQAIVKPHGKSNEAAQREIEEAVKRVKEAQTTLTAELDPEAIAPVTPAEVVERRRSRSPSKTHSTRSASRRSRSTERRSSTSRKRSLSRTKEKKRSKSRERKRSKSKEKVRKSRSRSKERRRRSKSREKERDRKKGRSRSRSRSKRGSSKSRDKDKKDRDRRDRKDREKSKDRSSDSKKDDKKKEERSRKRTRSRSRGKSPAKTSRRSRSRSKGRKDDDRKEKDRKDKDKDREKDRKRDRSPDRKKDEDRKRDKDKKSKDRKKETKVALDYDDKDDSPRRGKSDPESEEEKKWVSKSKGAKRVASDSEEERKPSKRVASDSEDDRKSDVSKVASEKSHDSSD
nr:EOG090X0EEC [Lepidurus arcticus]